MVVQSRPHTHTQTTSKVGPSSPKRKLALLLCSHQPPTPSCHPQTQLTTCKLALASSCVSNRVVKHYKLPAVATSHRGPRVPLPRPNRRLTNPPRLTALAVKSSFVVERLRGPVQPDSFAHPISSAPLPWTPTIEVHRHNYHQSTSTREPTGQENLFLQPTYSPPHDTTLLQLSSNLQFFPH